MYHYDAPYVIEVRQVHIDQSGAVVVLATGCPGLINVELPENITDAAVIVRNN